VGGTGSGEPRERLANKLRNVRKGLRQKAETQIRCASWRPSAPV
jgi:hypothetical protein